MAHLKSRYVVLALRRRFGDARRDRQRSAHCPYRGRRAGRTGVHQGRRADPPGEVPGVPSPGLHRADVARDLRGSAPVGALDQGARRGAADAAVAHRQDRRHPAVQERSLADATSRSTRSSAGSMPARRRATRRTCRRRSSSPTTTCGTSPSASAGRPISSSSRRAYTMPARAHDAWFKPVVETGLTEAALGARDRDPPVDGQGPARHASRARALQQDDPDRGSHGRPLARRRPVHGVGGRQAGRDHAARTAAS